MDTNLLIGGIIVIYFLSNSLPPIFVDGMSRWIKYEGIDWVLSKNRLRAPVYYLKLLYFSPYILSWVIITLIERTICFILFKGTK